MERLTTDRDYLADKKEYERHIAQGYHRNRARERFLRLCEYERTGLLPEQIVEMDKAYLEKCEEVNRLNAELAELKKQPQGDLISRSALINKLSTVCGNLDLLLPDQVWDVITAQSTAYDVDAVVEQLEDYLEVTCELSERIVSDAVDIIRKGGKE